MALIASKVCEYVRPDSASDASAAEYEYFLVWIGVDGGVYCWMFEDSVLKKETDGQVINTKSSNISRLFTAAPREVTLVAEDLSENEFDVISDITRALVVRRYYMDGSFENLAILTDRIEKPKSQFRYNLELEVAEIEDKVMR